MLNYSQTIPANVSYNEYQFVIVQARSDGFVEKVYPLTIGDHVRRKALRLSISPFLNGLEAQSEFLCCYPVRKSTVRQPVDKGVLERLRLAGMPEERIFKRLRSTPPKSDPFYR